MRILFVLCLVAFGLAAQQRGSTYKSFMASTYCKKHPGICLPCYNYKFQSAVCKKSFIAFLPIALKADGEKFYSTAYCMKNKNLCSKCANTYWKKGIFSLICNKAEKTLLGLYSAPSNTESSATPSKPKTPVFKSPALKEGLAQDPMSFYKAVSVGKGKPVAELGTTGVSLYDGLPWEPADKAFELDNDKVRDYEKSILGKDITFSIAQDNYCSKTNQDIDGILSADVAALPILAFREIDDAGTPLNWTKKTRPKKLAAILKKKDSDERYYLPCTCTEDGDAKGHTWPGGVAQTFLSNGKQKKNAWKFNTDNGHITGDIIGKTVTSLSAIRKGYSSVKYHWKWKGEMREGGVHISISLELHKKFFDPLNQKKNGYQLVGFVGWKE